MVELQAIWDFIVLYKWWGIFLALGIFALYLMKAYGSGISKYFEKWGEADAERIFKRVDVNDATRIYLEQASKTYSRFKFRGLPRVRAKGIEPPQLDQAYISVRVFSENKKEKIENQEISKELMKHEIREKLGIGLKNEPIQISEATKEAKRLAVIGVAGSGKSTLLQWAGLA